MTNKEFYDLMDKIFSEAKAIAKSKGEDYTKGSLDALANFKEAGSNIDLDPKKICFIFINKHYQAITNYIKTNGQSESEPIEERVKDLINYLVLLLALIVEDKEIFPKSTGIVFTKNKNIPYPDKMNSLIKDDTTNYK